MTELEINEAVSEKLGYIYTKSFDPCNNVEQAWEIMMKYNIGVVKNHTEDSWVAISMNGEHEHQKPLVAAMLCFLEL